MSKKYFTFNFLKKKLIGYCGLTNLDWFNKRADYHSYLILSLIKKNIFKYISK